MRNLFLTAAALLLCATTSLAQEKAPSSQPAKAAAIKEAPQVDALADQKRAISQELKGTHGMADELMAHANKMAASATDDNKEGLLKTVESIKTVQGNVSEALSMVAKADASNSAEIFGKATEVNAGAIESLTALKAELHPEMKEMKH